MKIVFLCGSLEPGRDGVGDYVRSLITEMLIQGCKTAAIALNDKHIIEEKSNELLPSFNGSHLYRLPSAWSDVKRFKRAKQLIDELDPTWLSLQFVPFSFHVRGLSFDLHKRLYHLGKGRSWHLMMHELWVGMDYDSPLKLVLWGKVQKCLIKALIKQLKPIVLHTQTPLYQAQLTDLGFCSQLLPLFSNIPNLNSYSNTHNLEDSPHLLRIKRDISLIVFGSIHPGAPINEFADDAAKYAKNYGVNVTLTTIGRCGPEEKRWARIWAEKGLIISSLGEQHPSCISEILLKATIGVVTTPAALIGKSGTAAAMHEHGLPVLCVTRPWIARGVKGPEVPSGVLTYHPGNFAVYLNDNKLPLVNSVFNVVQQLVRALSSAI